jgi:hypothetical protein
VAADDDDARTSGQESPEPRGSAAAGGAAFRWKGQLIRCTVPGLTPKLFGNEASKQFDLDQDQRSGLLIREWAAQRARGFCCDLHDELSDWLLGLMCLGCGALAEGLSRAYPGGIGSESRGLWPRRASGYCRRLRGSRLA